MRAMCAVDMPLNGGCLAPLDIRIPEGSLLSPSDEAAVCGGNVVTSQRITDVRAPVVHYLSDCAHPLRLAGRPQSLQRLCGKSGMLQQLGATTNRPTAALELTPDSHLTTDIRRRRQE